VAILSLSLGRMHSYPIHEEYQKRAEPLAEVVARLLHS
jgi:hypothetical protein